MRAKKSLGQHFLKSERALGKIIEASRLSGGDTVLEIGPGKGGLTKKLLDTGARVVAVEKDYELFEFLKLEFRKEVESGKLELICADILEFDLSKLEGLSYKLVANIPYNITGAIFKKFLSTENQPKEMVLLVQQEVAQRILARDGKESILSISVKVYGNPRFVEKVLAGSFVPMPKVDSAILAVDNISKEFFSSANRRIPEEKFFALLRAGFKSKRKKLSSNLSTTLDKEKVVTIFRELGIDENVRAEDLNLKDWRNISSSLLESYGR